MQRPYPLIVMALLTLVSCAPVTQTNAVSYIDPAWRGRPFLALIVETDGAGLQEQQAVEHSAAYRLMQAGIDSGASLDYIPPTRNNGEMANRHVLAQTRADGVLVVRPSEKQIISRAYPANGGFDVFGGVGGYRHNGFAGVGFGGPGPYEPYGYTVQEPLARYSVTLYSSPRFNRIWQAEFTVHGAGGMSFDTVAAHFAEQLVQRLQTDGLIAAR